MRFRRYGQNYSLLYVLKGLTQFTNKVTSYMKLVKTSRTDNISGCLPHIIRAQIIEFLIYSRILKT